MIKRRCERGTLLPPAKLQWQTIEDSRIIHPAIHSSINASNIPDSSFPDYSFTLIDIALMQFFWDECQSLELHKYYLLYWSALSPSAICNSIVWEINLVASTARRKEMKRKYHGTPRGSAVLPKGGGNWWNLESKSSESRRYTVYLIWFDGEVDDNSKEEGGGGQGKEGEDSRGKHVEDTMLCGWAAMPKIVLRLLGCGSGSSGDFYGAPPVLKQCCQQQHKDKWFSALLLLLLFTGCNEDEQTLKFITISQGRGDVCEWDCVYRAAMQNIT